ncbi:MAG: hypothetical protein AB7S92_22490 [Parvibaculaceae bacterium]
MGDMSPLGRFILIAMLWGVRFTAAALAAIFALVLWQKAFPAAASGLARQDYAVLAVLAALFAAALWFARAIARELRQ